MLWPSPLIETGCRSRRIGEVCTGRFIRSRHNRVRHELRVDSYRHGSLVVPSVEHVFRRLGLKPAVVEGDRFHRYNRKELKTAKRENRNLSHFGADGNRFEQQFELFNSYGETGIGMRRYYIHNEEEAELHGADPGTCTGWEPLAPVTDLPSYEGLHGGAVTERYNIRNHVALLIGVAPTVNLERIQKIKRNTQERGVAAD